MAEPISVWTTPEYERWRSGIRDAATSNRIAARIFRLERGLLGDTRALGGGVSELKLDFGPGYRIYFARKGNALVLLLCGGDKASQSRDITAAQDIWQRWKDKL